MATLAHSLPDYDAAFGAALIAQRTHAVVYLCEWPAIGSWSVEDRKPSIRGGKVLEMSERQLHHS